MRKEHKLEKLVARNKTFINMEEIDRPLYGISHIGSDLPLRLYEKIGSVLPSSGLVVPEMINSKDFLKDVDRLVLQHEKAGGDILWPASPLSGFPWMEAIVGCPINVSSGTLWAAPRRCDWQKLEEVNLSSDNKWLQKLLELQTVLTEHVKKKYPVGTSTLIRGPGDMMGAVLGQERLALELYDNLEKVKALSSVYTKVWVKVAHAQNQLTPKFHGGYVLGASIGLWTPGICQYMQEDALAYFSPKFYREVLLNNHITMSNNFEYSFFHLHPTSLYAVDELIKIKNLTIVEVNREVIGPSIEKLLPVFRKIQKYKPLFISWRYGTPSKIPIEAEIRFVLKNLPSKGLCLHFVPKDPEEGIVLMNLMRKVLKVVHRRS